MIAMLPLVGYGAYLIYDQRQQVQPAQQSVSFETWSRFHQLKRLNMLLEGFAIESIADLPCLGAEALDVEELAIKRYLGVAKDREVALALQARFGSAKSTYMAFDVTIDVLPKVDLILCWDYLCHLSPQEIRATLLQFKKSGATFLLMRHYPEVRENGAGSFGGPQLINWMLPPYNFPEPIIHIMESGRREVEVLALWDLAKL